MTTSDYGINDAALEQRMAELGDDEFNRLVERTRPPRISDMSHRELREHIARKSNASREITHRRANGGGPVTAN
jgi:hypothetical protein